MEGCIKGPTITRYNIRVSGLSGHLLKHPRAARLENLGFLGAQGSGVLNPKPLNPYPKPSPQRRAFFGKPKKPSKSPKTQYLAADSAMRNRRHLVVAGSVHSLLLFRCF